MATARTFQGFSGEGVHTAQLVLRPNHMGYTGAYSFEVFSNDCQAMPMLTAAARAYQAAA